MILVIEAQVGATGMEQLAICAAMVLGGAGFLLGVWACGQALSLRNRVDVMDDQRHVLLPPTPFEQLKRLGQKIAAHTAPVLADPEPEAQRPTPFPRTDTNESDLPLQVENVKLEAERQQQVPTTYREFAMADGTVHRFAVRSAE